VAKGLQARLTDRALGDDYGTIARVGQELFTRYLVPFEAITMLLLAAIVGGVVLALKRF